MSHLAEISCKSVLEAIKAEKLKSPAYHEKKNVVEEDSLTTVVNTFWIDLFANCFLNLEDPAKNLNASSSASSTAIARSTKVKNTLTYDDLLFFVVKTAPDDKKVEAYRRESPKLPCLTDLNYDWEETVYLNLVLHQFEFILTCAICTQTGSKDLEILKRHSKRVYASPSRRDLQSKGTQEVITYPNIYFMVDDFDDAFNQMVVNENEMVCVELLADDGNIKRVLFLGSIRYEALKKVYDARASTGAKLVQKMTMGNYGGQKRVEFVKMKGPAGKGYAEMAVSRHVLTGENQLNENNQDTLQGLLNFSNKFMKRTSTSTSASANNSLAATPEIEARDFTRDMFENRNNQASDGGSFWGRTISAFTTNFLPTPRGQTTTITTKNSVDHQHRDQDEERRLSLASVAGSVPLNAYLTYVTLKLTSIMHGNF